MPHDLPPGIQTLHRTLAVAISVLVVGIALGTYGLREVRPDLHMLGVVAAVIVVLQSMVGAIVVYSGLQLLATLAHAALMAALFVVLRRSAPGLADSPEPGGAIPRLARASRDRRLSRRSISLCHPSIVVLRQRGD